MSGALIGLSDLVLYLDECIRDGHADATLIPWNEERSATKAIADARAAFEVGGWEWNIILEQLEKRGWYAWFRSQGVLASPIIQWGRVSHTPTYESPNKQFSLF
jgi:hypothetical protein